MGRILAFLVIFLLTFLAAQFWDIRYNYADLKAFLDVLLNVSGAVFTLMGIWIAFLYPNALARIIDPQKVATVDFSESRAEYARLTAIVGSVLKSASVVLVIMALNLAKVLVVGFPSIAAYLDIVKGLALAASCTIFFIQSDAVLEVITANVMFLNDLHTKRATKQVEEEY